MTSGQSIEQTQPEKLILSKKYKDMPGFRRFQVVSGNYSWVQVVSDGVRWFQVILRFNKYDTVVEIKSLIVRSTRLHMSTQFVKCLNGLFPFPLEQTLIKTKLYCSYLHLPNLPKY